MKRILVLLLVAAVPAAAADLGLPLRSGDPVTILKVDGGREQARFVGVAQDPPRLLLAKPNARPWATGWQQEVPLEGIARLEAKGAADFKERRVLVGTLVGMVVGGVLGFVFYDTPHSYPLSAAGADSWTSDDGGGRVEDTVAGMAFGSAVGFLTGFFIAPSRGPARAWTFPDGQEAVPDTTQTTR